MKKLITIFLCVVTAFAFSACTAQQKDGTTTIRVNEVTHSVFYAPFYVAMEMGYFKDEGLEIDLTNGGGSDTSMTALLSSSADVALLGPETGIYTALGGANDMPVIFAQLTKRDGSFLMGREPIENFTWDMLEGKEIIAGRRGGSPAMSLEYALNKNGLYDGDNVTLNFDVQFNLTVAAFSGGQGDFVTMFEPTASEFVKEGKGYMIASVGEESGEVPFTCFMAKRSYADKNEDILVKFNKALYKAIEYIRTENEEVVATTLEKAFPTTEVRSIKDSIASYKRIDAWKSDLMMTKDSFLRLEEVMMNAGELERTVEFETLVDNGYAQKAYNIVYG